MSERRVAESHIRDAVGYMHRAIAAVDEAVEYIEGYPHLKAANSIRIRVLKMQAAEALSLADDIESQKDVQS